MIPFTCGKTDVGKVRSENQDAFVIFRPPEPEVIARRGVLAVVADGMGGLEGGRVASQLAVETLERCYFGGHGEPGEALRAATEEANRVIHAQSLRLPRGKQMGSTLTAVSICGHRAWVAQVGDRRAYRFREGVVSQLTVDHSLVQELASLQNISISAANWSQHRNIVTRGLGLQDHVEVDLYELDDVAPGDTFLLSSDGFHDLLLPEEIATSLERSGDDLNAACDEFIAMALERGGPDNITVVLARMPTEARTSSRLVFQGDSPLGEDTPEEAPRRQPLRRGVLLPLVLCCTFLAGVLLTVAFQKATAVGPQGSESAVETVPQALEGARKREEPRDNDARLEESRPPLDGGSGEENSWDGTDGVPDGHAHDG